MTWAPISRDKSPEEISKTTDTKAETQASKKTMADAVDTFYTATAKITHSMAPMAPTDNVHPDSLCRHIRTEDPNYGKKTIFHNDTQIGCRKMLGGAGGTG